MMYLGDFPADQAIYFMWNTNDASGGSVTRATDGTLSVYKDASNGTAFDLTQVTTGITNDEDVDGLTGVHSCCITTTNAWYETGHDYVVVLSASTIDGETVNAVIATFSIENRYMVGTDSAYTGTPPTVVQIRQEMDANSTKMAPSQTLNDYKATGFNTVVPDAAGVAPTAGEIRTEMEGAGTKLSEVLTDTGTTIPGTITALQTDATALDVLTESGGSGDLTAIKTQVDAILDLTRDSGTVSVTSAETTLFEDAAPGKNKAGVVVKIDMAALQAGDTFVVKEKYKDESGGAYQEIDSVTYTGAQTKPLRIIALTPYRYGAIITMQKTAGTDRSIEWESFVGE